MPRMRTIDQAIEWLKETDPDTALTKNALRTLVISGKLPHVNIGQKYLISLENLTEYLYGSTPEPDQQGGIRRIAG